MKILFVFNHPAPYKVKLFNLLSRKVDLDVIFERYKANDRPDSFYHEKDYSFNAIFLKHGAFSKENSCTSELKNFIRDNHKNYDLIIMNGYSTFSEIKAIKYMNKKSIPFYLYVNGGLIRKESHFKNYFKRRIISSAKGYFSPSKETDDYLVHYGAKKSLINRYTYSTIENNDVLNKPISQNYKEEKRKDFSLPNTTLFVTAGQFIKRKNNLELIKIFKNRNDSLLLIGDGKEKTKYLRFVEKNHIKNVFFHDFVAKKELFEILQICDAFITLSLEDIYGHTINEAMANGLPVISSSKVMSAFKLIKNNENGFIVELGTDFSKELDRVKELDFDKIISTSKNNTIEISAKEHLEIFERLLK